MLRKNTSPDEILQLLQTTGASKRSKLLWVSDKLVKPFTQFQGIFEATAAACSGIGAPIWAPIKVILQACYLLTDCYPPPIAIINVPDSRIVGSVSCG